VSKKRVLVLCGISGSGKTRRRTRDPLLRRLPFVDVRDIYKAYEDQGDEADWETVVDDAIIEVQKLLETHDRVVLEGYFLKRSSSRRMIRANFERDDSQVDFIDLEAPLAVCIKRIEDQVIAEEISVADAHARIEMAKRCSK